jgi:hypothetical protein
MSTINRIILNSSVEQLEKIISPFIEDQFPSFMKEDYKKLILFIKAYYEWLEQPNNSGYILQNLNTIKDIDSNGEEFFEHFKNTYLESFPDILIANSNGEFPNKTTLLKKIRDFYGNKGTENSYKFLFRLLYNSELEIYTPKEDILKVSAGEWYEPKSIKTTSSSGQSIFSASRGEIVQYETDSSDVIAASAFIDSIVQYVEAGALITEFFITNISGIFLPNRSISIIQGDITFQEFTYSVLGEFFIQSPGTGYVVGNQIFVSGAGSGFASIVEVTGLGGSIKKISIKKSGVNFFNQVTGTIINDTGTNSTATILFNPTAVTNYPGYFRSNNGKLSSNKKIQDGNYYQEFSYDLRSGLSIDRYFSVLNKIIHPAGMKMFGSILLQSKLNVEVDGISGLSIITTPLIGNYTPYTIGTTLDLRNNGVTSSIFAGDLYPIGYNPYISSAGTIVNGLTAVSGTQFVTVNGLYTYDIMSEGGRTAHNPLGSPIKSDSSSAFGYWEINHHSSALIGLSAGLSFGSITIQDFVDSANSVSATYRSIRSIDLTTGIKLTEDTYTGILIPT